MHYYYNSYMRTSVKLCADQLKNIIWRFAREHWRSNAHSLRLHVYTLYFLVNAVKTLTSVLFLFNARSL